MYIIDMILHLKSVILDLFQDLVLILTKFISPPYCIRCQNLLPDYTVLCAPCHDTLPKIAPATIQITPARTLAVHAFTAYQEPCDKLIHAKLSSRHIPFFQLGTLLAAYTKTITLTHDIIVPVPLHWQRKMLRGFNQAEILAEHVAKTSGKPVILALTRRKKTEFQSALSAVERKENVSNIFSLNTKIAPAILSGKRILLVDDLYTTGATAASAAHELYKLGAQSVELLVACKVID